MNSRVFVDTNVWVYAVDDAEPARQARAQRVLDPAATKDLVVSAQVLGESFAVVHGLGEAIRLAPSASIPDVHAAAVERCWASE